MTNPHAKAVEAAAKAVFVSIQGGELKTSVNIITAYLAAMRAEGWVMVRDCGTKKYTDAPAEWPGGQTNSEDHAWAGGWNDCRAAMLKGATDGQR